MENRLGVAKPSKARLFVVSSPVGPYFKEGFKAVPILISEQERASKDKFYHIY